jgi:chemotaxis protein methyltransferase CheR
MVNIENENIEIQLLLEAIFLKYGYDFRSYAKASVQRRILNRLGLSKLDSISEMQHKILYDQSFFETLLIDLSVSVTEMFRDPPFYKVLREEVIPNLKTHPSIKIWNAGCSTGEEAYSMAILLLEENLYKRAQIYATDFNTVILERAKAGTFSTDLIKDYGINYEKSGGKKSFSDYYKVKHGMAVLDQDLKKNIVFADHNLVTDGVFSEMNLILCRNVLIYFSKELQNRVIKLFSDSLRRNGYLCLGIKESLKFSPYAGDFEVIAEKEKIYRKGTR